MNCFFQISEIIDFFDRYFQKFDYRGNIEQPELHDYRIRALCASIVPIKHNYLLKGNSQQAESPITELRILN